MAEFVDGFEKLSKIGPCVSIFGSARIKPEHPYYQLAEEIAYKLTKEGYGIITGGGPGIMEAANKERVLRAGNPSGLTSNCHSNKVPIRISTGTNSSPSITSLSGN